MSNLGKKYSCYSCHTKFYDLGKPEPVCPKCGADQREAQESSPAPVRSRKAVVVPDEPDVESDDTSDDDSDDSSDDADSPDDDSDDDDDDDEEEEEF